jgi:uncharacterized membrane protein
MPVPPETQHTDVAPTPPPVATRAPKRDLETLVGGQWLTWLGVLTIFFGTAFFLAYDLGGHLLSGMGQIVTGLLVGALFVVSGSVLSRRAQRFLGQGLLGGGVALLFLAAYAAHGFHGLVSAILVYPFLLVVALIGAWVALAQNSVMVASLTLVGALVTPLLLDADGDDPTRFLFPYLVAVNLGNVIVAIRREWRILPLGGLLGTAFLVAHWWEEAYAPELRLVAVGGVGALWALYAIAPLFTVSKPGAWSVARSLAILGNGLAFELFLYGVLAPDLIRFRGLVASGLALVYVGLSRGASVFRPSAPGVRMTYNTGIALAALAIPIQFDLVGVTMGWTILGVALTWSGVQFSSVSHRAMGIGILALAAFRVVVVDVATVYEDLESYRTIVNGEFLAALLLIAALTWTAQLFSRLPVDAWGRRWVTPLVLAEASVLLWRISVETLAIFEARELADGASRELQMLLTLSFIWAVYAGGLILAGFLARYRPIRLLGVVILGFLVLKVFALDMQELERGYRIASFVGVGILLLAISVLYQRGRQSD